MEIVHKLSQREIVVMKKKKLQKLGEVVNIDQVFGARKNGNLRMSSNVSLDS